MTSATSSETRQTPLQKAALGRWKLETLTGLLGIQSLQAHAQRQKRNLEAEDRAARKALWGATETQEAESDDMPQQTILGDYHSPQPVVISSGGSNSSLGPLLAAALGMLGPLGGVAGYFVNQAMNQKPQATILNPPAQQTTTINQEDLTVRLLRPEDLRP
jgi:hypothetical protein